MRKKLKYAVFSLIPLFVLLLLGETVTRIKYYRMHNDPRYLVTPFIQPDRRGRAANALDLPLHLADSLNRSRGGKGAQGHNQSGSSLTAEAVGKMIQVRPCKDRMVYSPCLGESIPKTYNEYCWPGESFQSVKPEGVYRIIVVGGSTVEGHYVGDADLWTKQVEIKLNTDSLLSRQVEVINAGCHDFYSTIIRQLLHEKAFLFNPDMVLYYEAINEQQVSHPVTKIYGEISRLEKSVFGWIHTRLFFKSFLYTYLMEKYHFMKMGKKYDWFFDEERTRADFGGIIEDCRERGVEFVYVRQVIDYPLTDGDRNYNEEVSLRSLLRDLYGRRSLEPALMKDIHALNQRLTTQIQTTICLEKGVPVIDPFPAFDNARGGNEKLFMDIVHFTCYGERLLADCVNADLMEILDGHLSSTVTLEIPGSSVQPAGPARDH